MVNVYIELRYLRQLNRICPEVLDRLFRSLEGSARKNGGSAGRLGTGWLYQFDTAVVGSLFATARFLGDMLAALSLERDRVREYFALVELVDGAMVADAFSEHIKGYDSVILPDTGIFLAPTAAAAIGDYISIEEVPNTALSVLTGLAFQERKKADTKHGTKHLIPVLYADYASEPISALRNLVHTLSITDVPDEFSREEREQYSEGKKALAVFARFRFSREQPEYRVAACLDYFALAFRAANAISTAGAKTLRVRVQGSVPLSAEWNHALERLSANARFGALEAPQFPDANIDSLPEDLIDLAWILYRSVNVLYQEELPSLFLSLGKDTEFVEALGGWLHSAGILANAADFRSLNSSLEEKIAARVGDKKGTLDLKLASFLWTLYERGTIEPLFAFYEVLRSLGFEVPDAFLVSCLYREESPAIALETIRPRFLNPEVARTVAELERARGLYEQGRLDESALLAKDVLNLFQRERILAGEYRALSLIAFLSLARNAGDDAAVYLEYALENAELMRDPYSVLATRLDMAMVHFGVGNFYFALCALEQAETLVEEHYAKESEVLVLFMKGRIAFELGDYRNAELYFQTAASLASVHQIPESVTLCRVWYARALVHQHRFASAESILADCASSVIDAWVFLVESALVSGRAIQGIKFPDSILDAEPCAARWSLSPVSWNSGFSVSEDRSSGLSPETSIARRMYRAMRLYYAARYVADADIPSIVSELCQIARNALEGEDPYAAMYYYFCFDLGTKSPAVLPADTAGYLSRGFKYIQRRANEIGDNAMREQFMQSPTWNERLYRVARENMLI